MGTTAVLSYGRTEGNPAIFHRLKRRTGIRLPRRWQKRQKPGRHARPFKKKLDSCWETYIAKLRELTINQLSEQTTEIAAAALCYRELRNISWQKTWIEYFNQVENPLAEAQNAMLTMLSEETYRNFDVAMCGLMDQADLERGHNKEAVQEQSMQV